MKGSSPRLLLKNILPAILLMLISVTCTRAGHSLSFTEIAPTRVRLQIPSPAGPPADGFLVLRADNRLPDTLPRDGETYRAGQPLGNARIISIVRQPIFSDSLLLAGYRYGYSVIPFRKLQSGFHYLTSERSEGITQTVPLYPGLRGQALIDQLIADYKPAVVLSYDNARDTLFARIYNVNDSLRGVYSGYTIYLDPAADPSTDAFTKGINTEHSWPQSKGAVGNARSDMHHLFPVKDNVNSSRNNNPYAEIPDSETDIWYRKNAALTSIPAFYIDEYAEKDNDQPRFEPREDHKGNAARAMFYFYCMYKPEADAADPNFFFIQKDVLYHWRESDPVDAAELQRTYQIAAYQDNKANPFVLDSSLIKRAFFTPASDGIESLSYSDVAGNLFTLHWCLPASYDFSRNQVFILMREGGPVNGDPTGGAVSSYTASPVFGDGTELSDGSYVVYAGDGTTVTVSGLSAETTYYLKIWNVLDEHIWTDQPLEGNVTTGSDYIAQPGDIVITEIMKDPAAVYDSEGEWFEVFNAGDHTLNLNGWTIRDEGTNSHTISNGGPLYIDPHQFMVFGNNGDSLTNGHVSVDYQYSGIILGNGADEIILVAADDSTEIDRVSYDDGVLWPSPTGASMVFIGTSMQDNDDPALWTIATQAWPGSAGDKGSPGYAGADQSLLITALDDRQTGDGGSRPAADFRLYANYPNPFNGGTRIEFDLPAKGRPAPVTLTVYNALGQRVKNLLTRETNGGHFRVFWNGRDDRDRALASGVYYAVLRMGKFRRSIKMVLLQ